MSRRLRTDLAEPRLRPLADPEMVRGMRAALTGVHIDDDIIDYCVRLVAATRTHPQLEIGASPRGTLTLLATGRAAAMLAGRDFVVPDDIARLAVPALAHRVVLRPELWARRVSTDTVIAELLDEVPAPAAKPSHA
ncbi:MAG: AAA family ATPase [Nocardioidaceae bacterium]